MNKEKLKKFGEKLKEAKNYLEEELFKLTKKDKKHDGNWDTKFPEKDSYTGSQALEDAADQVEEYVNLLPVEYSMELRLKDIDLALQNIKKGTYGKCEKCDKDSREERLEIYPEARYCSECKK